jgi:PII-like signaling protein
MMLPEEGCLLRIFIGESDKKEGLPLYAWLVRKAKQEGLAGATVIRAIEGYGAQSHIHTARILQLSTDLPIIIEIIDTEDKINNFLPIVDEHVNNGLATLEKVKIRLYRSKTS